MNKITISKLEQLDFSAQAGIYDTTEIHLGVYYARISQGWRKNRREIEITYWRDGRDCAIDFASHCSTAKGAQAKIKAFFLRHI